MFRVDFRRIISITALIALCGVFQSLAFAQATVVRNGVVARPAGVQWFIRGAHNSALDEYFIVYADKGAQRIRGLRLASDGGPKSGATYQTISNANGITPDVSYDPSRNIYLAVWAQGGDILGRYLDATGNFISDSGQFAIGTGSVSQFHVRLDYNATNDVYMAVWQVNGPTGSQIQKRMIPGDPLFVRPLPSGMVNLDELSKTLVPNSPDVAWNSATNKFFVAWSTFGSSPYTLIKGQIFNGDGSNATGKFTAAATALHDRRPQVAANSSNGEFLIAFDNGPVKDENVYAVMYNSTGTLIKPVFAIATSSATSEWRPHATYNAKANTYFVTYNRNRKVGGSDVDDILGRVIYSDGTMDPLVVPVAAHDIWESHGYEDSGNSWAGIISSSTQPHILELYLINMDDINTSLVSVVPPVTTLLTVDTPLNGAALVLPFTISGWALDTAAASGTGVDQVDVWAHPTSGSPSTFLGSAALGGGRPDVGAIFGSPQFDFSGFSLTVNSGLPDGAYNITVHARNAASGVFEAQQTIPVTIGPDPQMALDTPTPGSLISVPFIVSGWAVDRAAPSGTGVDQVDVWALPTAGGASVFVGTATLGGFRGDVAAVLGESRFAPSGYSLTVLTPLAPGNYRIQAYARSTVTGTFNNMAEAEVTVQLVPNPWMALDTPTHGSTVTVPFIVSGWAIDQGSISGTGVDQVDVWAFPSGGQPAIFLGSAALGGTRPDVAALYGHSRFLPSGYGMTVTDLAVGQYTIRVYAKSTVTGTFNNWTSAFVTVQPVVSDPLMALDTPTTGSILGFPFMVQGWAIDRGAPSGTGVDQVDVWAFPNGGGSPIFLGTAAYGIGRGDVATVFGDPRFTFSGYSLQVNGGLPSGQYTITAFARSTVTGTYNNFASATSVTVP